MTASLAQIWRYPVKGVGAEPLSEVTLAAGRPLPFDRAWAILEEGGDASPGWRSCRNFIRGAKGPGLMAVTAAEIPGPGADQPVFSFRHPGLSHELTAALPRDGARLIDWLRPIYPAERAAPVALVESPPEGMADAPFASVSILNLASLRALGQKLGQALDPRRFRGNLWLDGLAPWEEFDLVGKTLAIGRAELEVVEPIGRCRATEANPETGRRDADTLGALRDGWGHTEFGIYARVRRGGRLGLGDPVDRA